MRSSSSGSSVSSFLTPRIVDGDDHIQVKFECKEAEAYWENSRAVRIAPHNSGTVTAKMFN